MGNLNTSESADPRIRFGKRLATVRKELGWSQEKLAIESGVARSYLSGVERGIRNIALLNICKLAETLSVTPRYLMICYANKAKCLSSREKSN